MNAIATLPRVPRSEHVPKLLRLPPTLAEQLDELAQRKRRPWSAQVILMLERALEEGLIDPKEDAPPTKEGKRPK